MAKKELPKLPHGQGSFSYEGDTIVFKKNILLPDGSKKRVRTSGETVKECMEKMDQLSVELVRQQKKKSNAPLCDAMNEWADTVKRSTLKDQSYDRLKSTIKNKITTSAIGHKRYQLITTQNINEIIQQLVDDEFSHSTIKKVYDALNDFYRYKSALEKFDNPMLLVTMPTKNNIKKETKTVQFFEQSDIDKFVEEAGATWNTGNPRYRYGYIIAANIYLGLRMGELLSLQWKDIDLDKNTIYINKTLIERQNYDTNKTEFIVQISNKTSKNRYVPINSNAKDLILKHKKISEFTEPEDYVVSTRNRRTNTIKNISDMIKSICINAETDIITGETHALRHTCASLYFRADVPIETICKILGNTREVCEKTYIHFIEEQLQNAASQQVSTLSLDDWTKTRI